MYYNYTVTPFMLRRTEMSKNIIDMLVWKKMIKKEIHGCECIGIK